MKQNDQTIEFKDQIDYLNTLPIKPLSNIIFLGTVSFAKTALSVLKKADKLSKRVKFNFLDLDCSGTKYFENEMRNEIEKYSIDGTTVVVGQVANGGELPPDKKALFNWLENLTLSCEQYDCVIVQHSTYKFIDGGISLIYGVLTRLISQDGIAWCVICDNGCSLVRRYKKYQIEQHSSNIKIRHFAGSFVVAMRSLFDKVTVVNERYRKTTKSTNCVNSNNPLVCSFEQATSMLRNQKCDNDDLICLQEQHIFIQNSSTSNYIEEESLQAAHALAECVIVLENICTDLRVHSAVIAETSQSTFWQSEDAFVPLDSHKGIKLIRHGFEEAPCFSSVMTHSNPTDCVCMLYSRRFFVDHAVYDTSTTSPRLYAFLRTSSIAPSGLTHALSGDPEYIKSDINCKINMESWSSEKPQLDLTSAATILTWDLAVGANLLSNDGYLQDKDPLLNSRCGLFITLSTSPQAIETIGYAIGHIKSILTQHLAQQIYQVAQERLQIAEKAEQMMTLMQLPLHRISEALQSMHSDTQELKSILYEPFDILYRSYALICNLFDEGETIGINSHLELHIQHNPKEYKETGELRALACLLFCRCCGVDLGAKLRSIRTLSAFSKAVVEQLKRLEFKKGFADTIYGLYFVCDIKNFNEILTADEYQLGKMVTNLKEALFLPFKAGESNWPGIALELLFCSHKQAILELRAAWLIIMPEWTPVRYSTVLSFLSKLKAEYLSRGAGRIVRRVQVEQYTNIVNKEIGASIQVSFAGSPLFDPTKNTRKNVCDRIRSIISMPRDWRMEHTNVGNFMAPFYEISSELLGIGSDWKPTKLLNDEILKVVSLRGKRQFRITVDDDLLCHGTTISLLWEDLSI